MARVTVEDCLEKINNRFALVVLSVHRTKQLMMGASKLVNSDNKEAVTSLREIAAGKIMFSGQKEKNITRIYDEETVRDLL